MAAVDPKLQASLNRIRLRFLSVLDERLDSMELNFDALGQSATRDAALAGIQAEAHKIAGTARTVGYAELGEIALTLDQTIGAGKGGGADLTQIEQLTDALIELGAQIVNSHRMEMAAE